jgi:hypothetical protein
MLISSLKNDLAEAIEGKTACLFFSGGSDSLLLLYTLLEMKAGFSIMSFDATFSARQKKLLDDLAYSENVRVLSYKPKAAYFIGDGNGKLAFVEEYGMLSGATLPFLRDCVGGEKCSYDVMVETRETVPIGFEVNIFGTRRTDRHWAWGKMFAEPAIGLGYGKIVAPLFEWTRKQVAEALKNYGLKKPKIDTGNYEHCCLCLNSKEPVLCPKTQQIIDPVRWQPEAMLSEFQKKFQVRQSVQVVKV